MRWTSFYTTTQLTLSQNFNSPMRLNVPRSVEHYPSRRQRPSFAIPFQPPSSRRIPSSISAPIFNPGLDMDKLPTSHFNSRGEYVESTYYAHNHGSPQGVSAAPWPSIETIRQSSSSENLQDAYICNYCQYSGPKYYLSSTCPSCHLDTSGARPKTTCTTSMIVPVNAQPLASTSTQRDSHSALDFFSVRNSPVCVLVHS